MKKELLYSYIYELYTKYDIRQFPIDCFKIIEDYGYRLVKYSELNAQKKAACYRLSNDACTLGDIVFYNDSSHYYPRMCFSLMHELGHIVLKTDSEDLADLFASHMIAPRIAIHKARCRTADQIHDTFGLSYMAANRALVDYRSWFDMIVLRAAGKPSSPEQQLAQLLFPPAKSPSGDGNKIPKGSYDDSSAAPLATATCPADTTAIPVDQTGIAANTDEVIHTPSKEFLYRKKLFLAERKKKKQALEKMGGYRIGM